jgi:hypothetical protein
MSLFSDANRICSIVQRRFIAPWLKPEPLFKLSPLGKRQEKCVKIIHNHVDNVRIAFILFLLRFNGEIFYHDC